VSILQEKVAISDDITKGAQDESERFDLHRLSKKPMRTLFAFSFVKTADHEHHASMNSLKSKIKATLTTPPYAPF